MLHWGSTGVRCIRRLIFHLLPELVVSSKYIYRDTALFAISAVKDYFAIEKGWFSPYLFATARRPIIPRHIKPDVVFCYGPFLSGKSMLLFTVQSEIFLWFLFRLFVSR